MTNYINAESLERIINFSLDSECKSTEWLVCFGNILSGKKCKCNKVKFDCSTGLGGWKRIFQIIYTR